MPHEGFIWLNFAMYHLGMCSRSAEVKEQFFAIVLFLTRARNLLPTWLCLISMGGPRMTFGIALIREFHFAPSFFG